MSVHDETEARGQTRFDRRQVLRCGLGLAAAAGGSCPAFTVARAADGFFEITAGRSEIKLYGDEGLASELWTYNGTLPGPEIRVKQGDMVRVRLINNLPEPTSIHWHGIRIANAMDGVAGLTQDAVASGNTFEYEFTVPDAGTYWYHAHNKSWNQVGRGLYGPLIVEEAVPVVDRDHELTLVMDDWRLDQDGRLDVASFGSLMDWSHGGRLGNWLTVNGKSDPVFDLTAGEPYRLRLINTSNARILQLDPQRLGGQIIAFDGQTLASPIPVGEKSLEIAPAQRLDLLVVPDRPDLALVEMSSNQGFVFARFNLVGTAVLKPIPVAALSNSLPEPDLDAGRTIRLEMTGGAMGMMGEIRYKGELLDREGVQRTGQFWAFNGIANVEVEPLFKAERDETIVIEFVNATAWPHAMHVHGHHFKVLGDDGTPGPWRDTFIISRNQTINVAFRADNPGKWLLHCHMLEHAAAGMVTWFLVG